MKLIIFDFEVFKYNTLLGCIILENNTRSVWQSWDLDEIRQFYLNNKNCAIWIGHNNEHYDNLILQAIVNGADEVKVKAINDKIIRLNKKMYLDIQLYYYDLISEHFAGLKTIEAFVGKNISETEVDFDTPRPLTEKEKKLTESYNRDDLQQTLEDFEMLRGSFELRLNIISEFGLDLSALHITGTQLAELVLGAKRTEGIETWVVKPIMYPQLQLKNEAVKDFYLNEKFKTKEKLTVELCGVEHQLGSGGIHGARRKYHSDWAYYFDVSGYYNLIMINYNLLPRSIPEEGKNLYKYMYDEQIKLKKLGAKNPELLVKRFAYKTILLSVFGAMTNQYCKFYDPYHGQLVTITGQIFLVDLLEKLEGKVELIQSNTDGIIAKPLPGIGDEEIVNIIDEWQNRTGFVLKLEKIYNIYQRDVNCYFYQDDKGNVHTLGEAVKHYNKLDQVFERDPFNAKEPLIIDHALVDYYLYGISPEETIRKNKNNLRLFQYICKKRSYDWMEYQTTNLITKTITSYKLQSVNRAFAYKNDIETGMIYKFKIDDGKTKRAKISNLPDSVFVYDNEVLSDETVKTLQPHIDYEYYVFRSYERIAEFAGIEV